LDKTIHKSVVMKIYRKRRTEDLENLW